MAAVGPDQLVAVLALAGLVAIAVFGCCVRAMALRASPQSLPPQKREEPPLPTMTLTYTAAEIAEILAGHAENEHSITVRAADVKFTIEPANPSADPREHRAAATLVSATVPGELD